MWITITAIHYRLFVQCDQSCCCEITVVYSSDNVLISFIFIFFSAQFFLSGSVLPYYEEQRLNQEQTRLWVSYLATYLSTPASTPGHLRFPDFHDS